MTDPTREDVDRLTTAAALNQQASERLAVSLAVAFRPFRFLLWALIGLMVLLVVMMGVQLWGTKNIIDGRSTSRATQATILDCTNPAGECAKRNQARTALLVTDLLERLSAASTEIAACTYEPTKDAFQVCADAVKAHAAAEAASASAAASASN